MSVVSESEVPCMTCAGCAACAEWESCGGVWSQHTCCISGPLEPVLEIAFEDSKVEEVNDR